jgi:CRISPR-associated protein Cmx8
MTKKQTTSLPSLEYDPLNPRYGVQHRAGMAGLYLQMEAMEWLRNNADTDQEKARYIVPEYSLTQDGRALKVSFTKESFFSLLRERYRGTWIEREFDQKKPERNKNDNKAKAKRGRKAKKKAGEKTEPKQEAWQFTGEFEKKDKDDKTIEDKGKPVMGYRYKMLYPLFDHLRAFGASENWGAHIREATWKSYYSSPPTRPGHFKTDPSPREVNKYAKDIWAKLSNPRLKDKQVEVVKNFYLNSFNTDFKDVKIKESAEDAVLLHFSSIVAMLYRPQHLEFKSDDVNGEKVLRCKPKTGAPIIAVPAVRDIEKFAHKFKQKIAACHKSDSSKSVWLHPDLIISTPTEGILAYFVAPQWAQKDVVDWARYVDGVEVFVFRSATKKTDQAVVVNVINQAMDEDGVYMLEQYNRLIKNVYSPPYRALRVGNLLQGRKWYEEFHHLAAQYPLELFVPRNVANQKLSEEANKMAQSIRNDLKYYLNIDDEEADQMEDSLPNEAQANAAKKQPVSLERLIYNLTGNYLRTRAREKFKTDEEGKDISFDFISRWYKLRKANRQPVTEEEKQDRELMRKYIEKLQKIGEDLFIKFRACRSQPKFARLFTEMICMKPFGQLTPENQERLTPYLYEADEWLRGKGLVLMSICATCSFDMRNVSQVIETFDSTSNPEESPEETESEDEG